ncbi:unnamed protein product [Rhizoctonia solani]|uniref:Uncharacterized protein n=1 Tax=Rhizoctonia solani TaxID=456999 RepID=A0A8H3DV02_9AGAM|nr:unnamed protein product [Rhizoctonia solani]
MPLIGAPGYSVDLANALKKASRRARGLGEVIQIDFGGSDSELAKWYHQRSTISVCMIQLRRELEGPYFHQFVAFKLANGDMFRIDRRPKSESERQLVDPDPLRDGVPSYDTIESVVSWNDPLFPESACMISIEFKVDVHLALILKICRGIQAHTSSRVYTLQRYNFFFAQTLIMCTACGASNWTGTADWPLRDNRDIFLSVPGFARLSSNNDIFGPKSPIEKIIDTSEPENPVIPRIKQFEFRGILYTVSMTEERDEPTQIERDIRSGDYFKQHIPSLDKLIRKIPREILEEKDEQDMHDHLAANLRDLLDQLWNERRTDVTLKRHMYLQIATRSIWDVAKDSFDDARLSDHVAYLSCRLLTPGPIFVRGDPPHFVRLDPTVSELQVPRLPVGMRATQGECDVYLSRYCFSPYDLSRKVGATIYNPRDVYRSLTCTCLDSFERNMDIEIDEKQLQGAFEETTPNNPQYIRAQGSIFRRLKGKPTQKREIMTTITIERMQGYIGRLIRLHSTRVEKYNLTATYGSERVFRDIRRAMDEIWKSLAE